MCPPPVKHKPNKGNENSKKGEESDVRHGPSQWEYVEGSRESQSTKKSCTKPTEVPASKREISL